MDSAANAVAGQAGAPAAPFAQRARPRRPIGLISLVLLAVLGCTVLIGVVNFVEVSRGMAFSAAVDKAQQDVVLSLNGLMDADQGFHRYVSGDHAPLSRKHYEAGSATFTAHIASIERFARSHGFRDASRAAERLSDTYRAWQAAYPAPMMQMTTRFSPQELAAADAMIDRAQDEVADLNTVLMAARQRQADFARHSFVLSRVIATIALAALAAIGLLVDVKRRREQAASVAMLEERAAALERSNAALNDFAYVASHDLQEPLRMVSSYTQLLGRRYKGKLDADADDFIGYAVDGAKRMQGLIDDILAYSRVSASEAQLVTVDVEAAYRRAVANLEHSITEAGAEVQSSGLPRATGDEGQLVQLLQNLIGNAVKYRRDVPLKVRVSAERRGDMWRFVIRDNGIGIAPEYYDRIFRMFQRLHGKSEYGGTGIGLAICKRIAERHGGDIWVESVPGQGSAFLFTLRAARERPIGA